MTAWSPATDSSAPRGYPTKRTGNHYHPGIVDTSNAPGASVKACNEDGGCHLMSLGDPVATRIQPIPRCRTLPHHLRRGVHLVRYGAERAGTGRRAVGSN